AMALEGLVAIRPAYSSPADVFDIAAPASSGAAPKGADISIGDASVSTQTGALNWSYPIKAAPGRNGMSPHLALSYSSQAPVYGGIAAGFSLTGVHWVTEDTSNGRITPSAKGYKSSLSGERPLIPVSEPVPTGMVSYRAQNDSQFIRYQRSATPPYW